MILEIQRQNKNTKWLWNILITNVYKYNLYQQSTPKHKKLFHIPCYQPFTTATSNKNKIVNESCSDMI